MVALPCCRARRQAGPAKMNETPVYSRSDSKAGPSHGSVLSINFIVKCPLVSSVIMIAAFSLNKRKYIGYLILSCLLQRVDTIMWESRAMGNYQHAERS